MHHVVWAGTQQFLQVLHVHQVKTQISLRILIRVFVCRMKMIWFHSYPPSAQQRLIRVRGCARWSESLMRTLAILMEMLCPCLMCFGKENDVKNILNMNHWKHACLPIHCKINPCFRKYVYNHTNQHNTERERERERERDRQTEKHSYFLYPKCYYN